MFSLLPRCHGEWGSQKYTGTPVATVNCLCRAISHPWSQVSEPRRCAGNVVISSAVGNGVADDKLTYTYVPDIIDYYLGERPLTLVSELSSGRRGDQRRDDRTEGNAHDERAPNPRQEQRSPQRCGGERHHDDLGGRGS